MVMTIKHEDMYFMIKPITVSIPAGCIQFAGIFRSMEQPRGLSARFHPERACLLYTQQCNIRYSISLPITFD